MVEDSQLILRTLISRPEIPISELPDIQELRQSKLRHPAA